MITVAGTVETFGAANFKVHLAASVGVEPAAITLNVTAASVRVVATIRVVENATDVVASVQLLSSNITALSLALNVTVESVAPPTVSVRAVFAPSPPPPSPPPSPPPPSPPPPSPFSCTLDFLSADAYGNLVQGSDGDLQMELVAALRLIEDIPEANSYDPYTCKVRDSFFYECLDIASPKTLSSSINGSYGVGVSSTSFTWLSDGLNTSSISYFGGAASCHDKITGDGSVNSLDVAVLMYYQFEMPPYGRANIPRTPAEVRTVGGRHDTWKRCGSNETRASWQLTVADDYCARSDNYTDYAQPSPPPPSPSPPPSNPSPPPPSQPLLVTAGVEVPSCPGSHCNTVGAQIGDFCLHPNPTGDWYCCDIEALWAGEGHCSVGEGGCWTWAQGGCPNSRRLSEQTDPTSQHIAQPANGRSSVAADAMHELGLRVCEWAAVPGLGQWMRIHVPTVVLSFEFFLSGLAIEQGVVLSNQKSPPFNCTECAPEPGIRDEPVVTFARFLEYEGVNAGRAATGCAKIVAVTPGAALDKNVLSLRQQPVIQACRFDMFVWIPQQPSSGVHVAAHAAAAAPCRPSAWRSSVPPAPMDGRGGQDPLTAAMTLVCWRAAMQWTGMGGRSSATRRASSTAWATWRL